MKKLFLSSLFVFNVLILFALEDEKPKLGFQKQEFVFQVNKKKIDTTITVSVWLTGKLPVDFNYSLITLSSASSNAKFLEDKTSTSARISQDTISIQFSILLSLDSSNSEAVLIPLKLTSSDTGVKVVGENSFIRVNKVITPYSTLKMPPVISLVTYTDFQGFKGDRPNGLVQFETNFTFYTNPNEFKRCQVWFRNMVVGVNLTKLDDNLRYKTLNYFIDTIPDIDDTIRHIHTFDLLQYSNFNIYLQQNILTVRFPQTKWEITGDLLGALYSTGLRDTMLSEPDFNINSIGFGFKLKIGTYFKPEEFPINFSFSVRGLHLNAYSNTVRQRVGPLYYPDSDVRNNSLLLDGIVGGKDLSAFQLEMEYFPSKENSGKIFFRSTYYSNIFGRVLNNENDLQGGNNFLQVQLGYAGSFSDFLERFMPAKPEEEQSKEVRSGK